MVASPQAGFSLVAEVNTTLPAEFGKDNRTVLKLTQPDYKGKGLPGSDSPQFMQECVSN